MTLPDEEEGEGSQEGYAEKDSQSTCYQNDKAAYFSQYNFKVSSSSHLYHCLLTRYLNIHLLSSKCILPDLP